MCSRAHRAANPSKFPISAEVKRLYPKIAEYAAKYPTPPKVHLQVYDGCAHVLPILFAFTTPAKYCFRAIADFCRFATGVRPVSPGPSSPTDRPESPLHRSFLGGSLFTSPPEEDGDLLTESRRRASWWGGGKDSLLQRKASRTWKKSDKEKPGSDKESSKGKLVKAKKKRSRGDSKGEEDGGETVEVEGKAEGEGLEKDVKEGSADSAKKVEKEAVRVKVVGKVEMMAGGSLSAGKDKANEVLVMDEQPKTETEDDNATSLKDAKSLPSLSSSRSTKGSRGSAKPGGKRWSLMLARKSTPDEVPIPSKKLTDDVAGPRFEAVKEPGERCAGDYPSVYSGAFVSYTPSPKEL